MTLRSLTWHQVCIWRLSQHYLSPRLQRRDFLKAATRTGGIQAQVMSAAELALGARVEGLSREDVQAALWRDRTLIKTWAMRGTLHLLTAEDLPLYATALTAYGARDWLKDFIYFGMTEAQYEAVIAAVPQVLGSEPMTREQLASAVAWHIGAPEIAGSLLASSWGSLWKASAWRGDLCFGPNQGRNVTFVNPSKWIDLAEKQNRQPIEPYAALQEIARRFLWAYGPARVEDFALWWSGGAGLGMSRKLFRSIQDELEDVDVEGRRALALRATLEPMQRLETEQGTPVVRLLPLFDAYTLGVGRNLEPLLPAAYKGLVYRPQGWISAVVLVDGRTGGVWEYKIRNSRTLVSVHMFSSPSASMRKAVETEVEWLGTFLNTEVAVEFEVS